MNDNNVNDIMLWIVSFLIILSIVFLLFYKISIVSSNEEFFAEFHSFQISNIVNSLFLEENSYFKTPYSLGKLKGFSLSVLEEDENKLLVLKLNNIPYKNLLLIPKNSIVKEEDNLNNVVVLEKNFNTLNFKNLNFCSKISEKHNLDFYKNNDNILFFNQKENFNNIVVIVSEDYNSYCNVFLSLKNFYTKKNVILVKIPKSQFELLFDKNIVLFFS